MKRVLAIILVLLLSGCGTSINEEEVWDEINEVEFHSFDVFAGQGIYFFEEDNIYYGRYMRFGSGLPVLLAIDFEITEIDGNRITMQATDWILEQDDPEPSWYDLTDIVLIYDNGEITWEDHSYTVSELQMHDEWPPE